MHLDATIGIGLLWGIFLSLVAILWRLQRSAWEFKKTVALYGMEHEMLMQKYCQDLGIKLTDLPTRVRPLLTF